MNPADEPDAGTENDDHASSDSERSAKDRHLIRAPLWVDARLAAAIIRKLIEVSPRDSGDPQEPDLIPAPFFVDTGAAAVILRAIIDTALGGAQEAADDAEANDEERALLRLLKIVRDGKRSRAAQRSAAWLAGP